MTEFTIDQNSLGQRLDRYLKKLLPKIDPKLIQKSIRKKNITVNNKKAKANQILNDKDLVQIYFSDETINKFKGKKNSNKISADNLKIIKEPAYEDDNFIVLNKPVGILTQPDSSKDISISDIVSSILNNESTFSPAPLNRLDRNTSGIIIVPKNYQIQKLASELIKKHSSKKTYLTLVKGKITKEDKLIDSYSKDENQNKAVLSGESKVELEYKPVRTNGEITLLEVNLITGKSHQIRAQLSSAGFPIIGDPKYGDLEINRKFKEKYGLNNQLLHAQNYILYDNNNEILNAHTQLPDKFSEIIEGELKA